MIVSVAALDRAGPGDLTFFENAAYAHQARVTAASACFVGPRFLDKLNPSVPALISLQPYRDFAAIAGRLFPSALRPGSLFGSQGVSPAAYVHPDAKLEDDVTVDPGAVIAPGAEIGAGTVVGPGAVIGPSVTVGRQCSIGPHASIMCAHIGNRVILHGGCRIGQDGFGFAMGRQGHLKVPQIGRVIVQDDVEIGAGSCVDRGATRDTVIGEGTKIDNQVQIGHNVVIGRHCVIVSQVGISGSAILEDFVVLGGHVGVVGHVRIGAGSQIAGSSNVKDDVPPGSIWGGTPAKPLKEWFREMAWLRRMAQRPSGDHTP